MINRIMANVDVKLGIKHILERVEQAYSKRSPDIRNAKPSLVAVSKTKPIEMIVDAYSAGQRHFGENYVKELWEKSTSELINAQCPDICWHFIGHLQSSSVNKLLKVPRLDMVETLDSIKLANELNKKWGNVSPNKPLKVLVQVNTSQEEAKSGIEPSAVTDLYRHITENCKHLLPKGVMTIGKFGYDYSLGPNPDFVCLLDCHKNVCDTFNLSPEDVHISMGMSDDFEQAIEMGSTIVRVGSSIFGYRPKKIDGADA
ncbi:pyridoxal phosphate homeostasis protein [Sitodiplosis mosellana]|uniref:pyridoxal phosphate homeostasis protein n=1 Tax=Sitodiplosis mosellana TaxID=263140 RepID=UPI002444A5C1|nr:pyridoxal phosphate homeostasis protein [Sitodiplosis mosellana]